MSSLDGLKVFVLERSQFIQHTIKEVLTQSGVEVQVGSDSATSLLQILRWHPDVLVSSVEVGALKGFDLALILKLMPDYASMPIIIISSGEGDQMTRKAADAGADVYVSKDKNIAPNIIKALHEVMHLETASIQAASGAIRKRVMILDDSVVMRRIISNILDSVGQYEIFEGGDGEDGLDILGREDIDLVLTDWNMPNLNGLEFISSAREISEYDDIPIVMVTTEGGKKERELASNAGANAHICKPFSKESLKSLIDELLHT